MSRAQGRHSGRRPEVVEIDPESPEGRQLGMSPRTQGVPAPIPGGRQHLSNALVMRQKVPVKAPRPEITDLNAHGVPHGSATTAERAELERGGPNSVDQPRPQHTPSHDRPQPIPVYVVQDHRQEVLRTAAPHSIRMQASTGVEVRLCGRDLTRSAVWLLNESTSSNIRIAQRPADLTNGGGALLPWPSNSYLKIETQDELYGISADSGTPLISIIQVFERGM